MAIGINWTEIWAPVWADVWRTTAVEPTTSGADGAGRRRRLYLGPDKKVRIEDEPPRPAEPEAAAPMPAPVQPKPAAPSESVADVLKRIATPPAPISKPVQPVAVDDAADQAAQAIKAAAIARQRQFEEDDDAISAAMALLMA